MGFGLRQWISGHLALATLAMAALLMLLIVAATTAWWPEDAQDGPAAQVSGARSTAPETLLAVAPPAARPADQSGPPEGMTAEQWAMLQTSLKDDPHRQGEIARITDYMAFLSRVARFRALHASAASELPEAQVLARGLLESLPRHVALGETSAGEARLLQQALIDALYPNDDERNTQREVQRHRLEEVMPPDPSVKVAAELDSRYQRQQSALVAQWYSQPEAQRDTRELEASLETLRRSVYTPPPRASGGTKK